MTRVGLLGDVHGDMSWMQYALNKFSREGITDVIQVGDFGVYQDQNAMLYLKRTNLLCEQYGIRLLVTPGNHEDYDYINSIPVQDDGWQHLRKHIWLAPRGHRWEMEGRTFVSLGGAPSVNRFFLTGQRKRKAWWFEEQITREDVDKTVAGGYADVMVAHDAPFAETIQARIEHNPHGWTEPDLQYAYEGRKLIDEAFRGVRPEIFVHGHYHFLVDEWINSGPSFAVDGVEPDMRYSHVLGLDCNQHTYSLGAIDLETLTAEAWDIREDRQEYFAKNLNLLSLRMLKDTL